MVSIFVKKMKKWFETWFDTKYYHMLYRNRDFVEAENFITKLSSKLAISKNDILLDLACGKGRHSFFLNQLGFDVLGVDLSNESIQKAKENENERLKFKVHDMRNNLPHSFNYVLNLFTSIGYFEDENDNIKMLNSIHTYLKNDGVLVIDFMNQKKVIANLVKNEIKKVDDIEFNITRKLNNNFIEKHIEFSDQNENFKFMEKVQALTLEKFKYYFEQSNFEIINLFGDYNLNEFDIENSDRLIIFAKKK